MEVRRVLELVVGDRQLQAVAEDPSSASLSFFAWWVMLRASTPPAEGPALDGLGEDHRRRADVLGRRLVGGVDLAVVVAAAAELEQLSSSDRCSTIRREPRVGAEEVLADVVRRSRPSTSGTRRRASSFIFSTSTPSTSRASSSSHSRPQTTLITFQPAPRNRPSSSWMTLPLPRTGPSSRCRLQLMTKVRLSRPSRAASEMPGDRLGLVHLAVAEERPHALLARVLDAAVLQVAVEARLVDRGQRAEAHRDRRELPEVGHQPRVRVRAQALAADLAPEVVELVLGQPALEERAGVDARAPRGPGRTPGRRRPDGPCPGRSG